MRVTRTISYLRLNAQERKQLHPDCSIKFVLSAVGQSQIVCFVLIVLGGSTVWVETRTTESHEESEEAHSADTSIMNPSLEDLLLYVWSGLPNFLNFAVERRLL